MFGEVSKGAKISEDGRYRYALLRRWGDGPFVTFVMLNPSTADAEVDDPTIRRCIGFAKRWGFDALHVVNLFALRATDPRELAKADDPIGPENDLYLMRHALAEGPMVAAWGAHPMARERAKAFTDRMFVRWSALGTTADGYPRHPLYVRADAPLIGWEAS
jgi:hypothetical protein